MRWQRLAVGAVALGVILRLLWPADMAYGGDDLDFQAAFQRPWTLIGFPTNAGIPSPALQVWLYSLPAQLFALESPLSLAIYTQLTNAAAVLILLWLALYKVPAEERETWIWTAVIAAGNYYLVYRSRIVLNVGLIPILSAACVAGWWSRDRWVGAFAWGLFGGCLGQVHGTGFFIAGGLLVATVAFPRRRVAWAGWLAGSVIAGIMLLPWLRHLLAGKGKVTHSAGVLRNLTELSFPRYWLETALNLRAPHPTTEPLYRFPSSTYLLWALELGALVVAVLVLARAAYGLARLVPRIRLAALPELRRSISETSILMIGTFVIPGVLLTCSSLEIFPHYLLAFFPAASLVVVKLAFLGGGDRARRVSRGLLGALAGIQLAFTSGMMTYVHVSGDPALAANYYDAPNHTYRELVARGWAYPLGSQDVEWMMRDYVGYRGAKEAGFLTQDFDWMGFAELEVADRAGLLARIAAFDAAHARGEPPLLPELAVPVTVPVDEAYVARLAAAAGTTFGVAPPRFHRSLDGYVSGYDREGEGWVSETMCLRPGAAGRCLTGLRLHVFPVGPAWEILVDLRHLDRQPVLRHADVKARVEAFVRGLEVR